MTSLSSKELVFHLVMKKLPKLTPLPKCISHQASQFYENGLGTIMTISVPFRLVRCVLLLI